MQHNKLTQQGVALITVLLIVAMATVLAVAMVKSQQNLLRRSGSVFSQDQAYLYTLGAESFAKSVLQDDKEKDKNKSIPQDALNETWAKKIPAFPVEGGFVQAQVEDLQGRFNLNNLLQDDGQVNVAALAVYQRLLVSLDISAMLASPVIDWLDKDNLPYDSDGAEEDWYLRLKPAYRAANHPFVSISELALLRGYTPEIVAKLRPYVCALPKATTININTAPDAVLAALTDNLTLNMAKDMVQNRPKEGYGSVDNFLQQAIFATLSSEDRQKISPLLGVTSQFFSVLAESEIDNRRRVLKSVIAFDEEANAQTITRDWSQQWQINQPKITPN
ncbi:MAG: type II secretion system minor pseudopilin GspK [Moraxellaceae bacterium]|nr:type II secretion system minor pseudopilin GspK [Pseudomonadales bacterium]MCP5175618.1 type II secretion system minor pseudopilin GspK [Moraxellaceae bacterium]